MVRSKKILMSLLVFWIGGDAYSQLDIRHFETPRLDLVYPAQGLGYMVHHTGRCFENALNFHCRYWDYRVSEPVTVLFNDFTDIGSGGANVIPFNFVSIAVGPFDYTLDVLPANERMQWLMNHELTHVVMCDKAARSDVIYRKVFLGKIMPEQDNPMTLFYSYLTTPRWYSPRWYHEGIATFMETWMSGGMGRVLGPYDEMVFRTMVLDSAYFYRPVGLESEGTAIDFKVGANAYLYGTRFFSYLGNKYGVEKLKDFCSRSDSSRRFYALQFKKAYGLPLSDAWEDWVRWEQHHQKENTDRIAEYPVTPFTPISGPLGSVSRYAVDKSDRKIIAAINHPGKMAHICTIDLDNGAVRKIRGIPAPNLYMVCNLAYDEATKTVFYSDKNQSFRGLRAIDLKTGRDRRLIKYTRAGDFAFNRADRCLYATQSNAGRVSLIRIPPPYKTWSQLYLLPFGYSLFNLDVSLDGKHLSATLADVNGYQKLLLYDLDAMNLGKAEADTIYAFEDNSAANFVFAADGKSLYGTSYYTGVSNVFRVDIQKRDAALLTNGLSGYFKPVEWNRDTVIALQYGTSGMTPGFITVKPIEDANAITYLGQEVFEKNPEVEQWMLPPPSRIPIDSLILYHGKYGSVRNVHFASAIPIIEGYKDHVAYGYRIRLQDHIFFQQLKWNISWSPALNNDTLDKRQKFHSSLDYTWRNFNLSAAYNQSDFYDLFGPNRLSRAGYSVNAAYNREVFHLTPLKYGYTISAATYGDLESLPEFQNVSATEDKMHSVMLSFRMSYLRKSLGATEDEQGYEWRLYGQGVAVGDQFFPKLFSRFDLGFLLPWRNATLWFKTAAGMGFAERNNPFGNFYFGSFGYNYLDTKSGSRQTSRDLWSFPGLEIDEEGGKNFARLKTVCNLPPVRFRKLGFLWFYITYARLNVFSSVLETNLDNSSYMQSTYNAGTQLDIELVLFSLMKSTLSFGWATAFRENRLPGNEWMVTLRLL